MNTRTNHLFGLIIVIAVAVSFRFWQLGSVPPSPDWDEAALGYNAYSILKTGKDEYATRLPLSLRSFDDYKPPLYMYLTVPAVSAFGLSAWSTRLPSAVMGTLAVVGTYVLVLELLVLLQTKSGNQKLQGRGIRYIPFFSALLLALSPWHIQFSRIAFEANTGVTLNIWAVALFLHFLNRQWGLWISGILFGLGLYAYHSERIFLPLLVLILLVVFHKDLLKRRMALVWFVLAGIVTVLPLVPVFFNSTTLTRLRGTSSLADQTGLLRRSVSKLEYDRERGDQIGALFENRRIVWATTLASGYLSHFSPKWLFLTGDNARHHAPDMGMLYLWELPFILWGMYAVTKNGGRIAAILWGWLFIAPLAAAPTTELPHGIRTLVFLPVFQIFAAFGIGRALTRIRYHLSQGKQLLSAGIGVFAVFYGLFIGANILYYAHMYFGHTNIEYSKYWQYGYKEAVEYAQSVRGNYKKIVVSTDLEQPHMFFLFFMRYDPVKYLAQGGTASGGFREVKNRFDIYEFRPIDWDEENHDGSVLYIGTPLEIPSPVKTIDYLDGTEAIRIGDR